MNNMDQEVMSLLERYGSDIKSALRENRKVEYLYALSELRENLLEWYGFQREASLLQVGAGFGALTGLFCRRVNHVTVLDECQESLDVVRRRFPKADNIRCILGSLTDRAGAAPGSDKALCAETETGKFDYITIIGSETAPYREQIEAAKKLLCPGGTLIVAACNRLGMKYFAGANRDDNNTTKKELELYLSGGSFYYPMPDYRVPSVIYSEQYLPKKGDLTRALAVYDYPKYLLLDVGAAYDMVCEDGRFEEFANSFLVMWKKGE